MNSKVSDVTSILWTLSFLVVATSVTSANESTTLGGGSEGLDVVVNARIG